MGHIGRCDLGRCQHPHGFAIRDVGLAVAFPLWNTNSLVGLLWGLLLFNELKGAAARDIAKVVLGAIAILGGAILLGFSTIQADQSSSHRALAGDAFSQGLDCPIAQVALYARVSTLNNQDPEMQLAELREYAARRWLADRRGIHRPRSVRLQGVTACA